ncbi:MAG: Holliday junction resolvase RuvX [Cyanobacteria bacterium P01_A01_bin.17]
MISALGLDLGHRRIGVAGCDRTGLIATGLTTIHRTTFAQDTAQLRHWVQERQVEILVAGLPYNMDGQLGTQARRTQKLARRFAAALQLPLEYMDERLTSYEAELMMQAEHISPSQNKGMVDRKAAALILQQWLDQKRQQPPSHEKIAPEQASIGTLKAKEHGNGE